MRRLAPLLAVLLVSACGATPAPAPRPRPAAPLGARAAADAPAAALAKAALGGYAKHLEAALKALNAKDAKGFTQAVERMLEALVEALRGVSKAMKADPAAGGDAHVDRALAAFEGLKARYDALPGDLALDQAGEKERLVTAMERTLIEALAAIALPPPPALP